VCRGTRTLPLAGVRILLVHNYEPLRWLKERLLRSRGADVVVAATGEDALASLDEKGADVAIVDSDLPDMPADEVKARMRMKPTTAAIPVVYICGSETDLPPHGGEGFLREPVDADELAMTVLLVLGFASLSKKSPLAQRGEAR
jgi:CheY-like chemotaxis protein